MEAQSTVHIDHTYASKVGPWRIEERVRSENLESRPQAKGIQLNVTLPDSSKVGPWRIEERVRSENLESRPQAKGIQLNVTLPDSSKECPVSFCEEGVKSVLSGNEILEKRHICPSCDKRFGSSDSLYRHKRYKHAYLIPKKNISKLACNECPDFHGNSYSQLIQHHNEKHDKNMQLLSKQFQTMKDFRIWKSKIERETSSRFICRRSCGIVGGLWKKVRYNCHRSGDARAPRIAVRKRKEKRQGSCKIGTKCTAHMITRTHLTEETVNVEYCLSHTGHTFDPTHQKISEDFRMRIASKLSQGIETGEILQDMKKETSDVDRDSLLTRKDIINIKNQYKIAPPSNENRYICSLCNSQYKTRHGLSLHKVKKHPSSSTSKTIAVTASSHFGRPSSENFTCSEDEIGSQPNVTLKDFECGRDCSDVSKVEQKEEDSSYIDGLEKAALNSLTDIINLIRETRNASVLQVVGKGLSEIYNVAYDLEIMGLKKNTK